MSELLWECLTSDAFYRMVLKNIERYCPEIALVRFGTGTKGGDGARPNYQICCRGGEDVAILGSNHKPNCHVARYADKNLSEKRYSYEDIRNLLAECLARKGRR